jgi:hypothetical protein
MCNEIIVSHKILYTFYGLLSVAVRLSLDIRLTYILNLNLVIVCTFLFRYFGNRCKAIPSSNNICVMRHVRKRRVCLCWARPSY